MPDRTTHVCFPSRPSPATATASCRAYVIALCLYPFPRPPYCVAVSSPLCFLLPLYERQVSWRATTPTAQGGYMRRVAAPPPPRGSAKYPPAYHRSSLPACLLCAFFCMFPGKRCTPLPLTYSKSERIHRPRLILCVLYFLAYVYLPDDPAHGNKVHPVSSSKL